MKRLTKVLALLLTLSMVAGACGSDDDEGAAPAATTAAPAATTAAPAEAPASDEPIKFGFLNGQSGDYGPWGGWALAAAEVAVEELNAAGGVLGRPVELIVEDNGSTPEGAVSGYAKLTEVDKIDALGGIESDGMLAVFDTVHEQQLPTICSTCGTSELDMTGGDFVFRIISSDTDNGIVGAQVARDEGYKNVAMLVELSEGTISPADVFKSVFTDQIGGTITEDVRFDAGRSSYSAEVARAFGSDPDAVYIAAGFETGIPLLNEWKRRGHQDIPLILTTDLLSPDIAEIISGTEGASAIAATSAYDTVGNPAWDAYVPRFEAKIGDPPEIGFYDAWQYDQYIILGLAMEAAGTTDGAAVAAAIPRITNGPGVEVFTFAEGLAELAAGNEINYHGTTSNMDLNDYGNLESPVMSVMEVAGGSWIVRENIELDPTLTKPSGEPAASVAAVTPECGVGGDLQETSLLLPFPFAVPFFSVFVADSLGYFEQAGLDVSIEFTDGSSAVVQQVIAGNVDFGMSDPGPVIDAVALGEDLTVPYVFQTGLIYGLVTEEGSPYTEISDFVGETVAVSEATAARATSIPRVWSE